MKRWLKVFEPFIGWIPLLNRLRKARYHSKVRASIRRLIDGHDKELKVNLGAGGIDFEGWIATDYPFFDITNPRHWNYFFKRRKPLRLLAEHVLEHLTEEQVNMVFRNASVHLKVGGSFRIAVPDAWHSNPDYVECVRPGGWGHGSDDHKTFWNIESLSSVAEKYGFQVVALEYFDADKNFRSVPFDDKFGIIRRSRTKGYKSLVEGSSSLIIDCIKDK